MSAQRAEVLRSFTEWKANEWEIAQARASGQTARDLLDRGDSGYPYCGPLNALIRIGAWSSGATATFIRYVVLVCLCRRRGSLVATFDELAELLGVCKRTAVEAVNEAIDTGWVRMLPTWERGPWRIPCDRCVDCRNKRRDECKNLSTHRVKRTVNLYVPGDMGRLAWLNRDTRVLPDLDAVAYLHGGWTKLAPRARRRMAELVAEACAQPGQSAPPAEAWPVVSPEQLRLAVSACDPPAPSPAPSHTPTPGGITGSQQIQPQELPEVPSSTTAETSTAADQGAGPEAGVTVAASDEAPLPCPSCGAASNAQDAADAAARAKIRAEILASLEGARRVTERVPAHRKSKLSRAHSDACSCATCCLARRAARERWSVERLEAEERALIAELDARHRQPELQARVAGAVEHAHEHAPSSAGRSP